MFIPALTITDVATDHSRCVSSPAPVTWQNAHAHLRTRYFSFLESVCLLGPGIGYGEETLRAKH